MLKVITDPAVAKVFADYPDRVRSQMRSLRSLVLKVAEEMEEISHLEETLKWGEPSYISKIGSTLRMDWKAKQPDQYALYFSCSTRLVETFRIVFGDTLTYEGNRAIILTNEVAREENTLKACIQAALTYKKVKHLPFLGM